MLAHEIAHQKYYKKNKEPQSNNLENGIFEGHAMKTTEKITHKLHLDWNSHCKTQKTPEVDTELIIQILDIESNY